MSGYLRVMMGVPASGKSTYIADNLGEYFIVSPDEIREEVTGDRSRQDRNSEVFKIAHQRVTAALDDDNIVVFDATNVRARDRETLLALAKNAERDLVVIRTPFEACLERNAQRTFHQVPVPVMLTMQERFTRSLSEIGHESWDAIYNIWL